MLYFAFANKTDHRSVRAGALCLEFKYWMTGGWDKLRVLIQRRNGQVIGVGEFNGKQN